MLLRDKGMLAACPACGLEDELIEYTFLLCKGEVDLKDGGWLALGNKKWSLAKSLSGCNPLKYARGPTCTWESRMAYVAYRIWLSRNSLIFEIKIVLAHQVLERACSLIAAIVVSTLLAHLSMPQLPGTPMLHLQWLGGFFSSLRFPPSRFVKINFNGNVRNGRGGADYVIRDPDAKLLATKGSHLFKPLGY